MKHKSIPARRRSSSGSGGRWGAWKTARALRSWGGAWALCASTVLLGAPRTNKRAFRKRMNPPPHREHAFPTLLHWVRALAQRATEGGGTCCKHLRKGDLSFTTARKAPASCPACDEHATMRCAPHQALLSVPVGTVPLCFRSARLNSG
eukprot:scaffold72348_cov29-Tisochrysis_lutea.AAC.2